MTPDDLLTPERRAAARETQDLRRQRQGHRVLTDPAQIKFRWGEAREQHAFNQLRALSESGRPDAQRENELLDQLAEGKAAQGKFAEAAAICKSEIPKAEYEAKALALQSPGVRCACPAKTQQRQPGSAKALETDTQLPVERIWTGQEIINLLRCVLCGQYSVSLQGQQE